MRVISLLFHDAVGDGNPDSSGFPGPSAARYKLDVDEMERHFAAIARSGLGAPSTVYDLLRASAGKSGPPGLDPKDRVDDSDVSGFADSPARCGGTRHLNLPCVSDRVGRSVPWLLTFDDGGISAALCISKLLDKFGWVGHFFVVPSYTNTPGFLSAEQILELRRKGHIIGSHSWSHPARMDSLRWDELLSEWKKSVDGLTSILGEPVDVASVPGGWFSERVARAAFACGIRVLFTSEPTKRAYCVDGCLVLGRYTVRRGMAPGVSVRLLKATWSSEQVKQYVQWNARKFVKRLCGNYYLAVRSLLLRR